MIMEEVQGAQLATAKEFNVPLYYVQINDICYERGIEWFYVYLCPEEE